MEKYTYFHSFSGKTVRENMVYQQPTIQSCSGLTASSQAQTSHYKANKR